MDTRSKPEKSLLLPGEWKSRLKLHGPWSNLDIIITRPSTDVIPERLLLDFRDARFKYLEISHNSLRRLYLTIKDRKMSRMFKSLVNN